jgi:hypothetical protein
LSLVVNRNFLLNRNVVKNLKNQAEAKILPETEMQNSHRMSGRLQDQDLVLLGELFYILNYIVQHFCFSNFKINIILFNERVQKTYIQHKQLIV